MALSQNGYGRMMLMTMMTVAVMVMSWRRTKETSRTERLALDDGSFQVRSVCAPGQPIVNEHREHMTTRRLFRSWCQFCVVGRRVSSPHRRPVGYDVDGTTRVSMDCELRGEIESDEQVTPALVMRERRHKMMWAMLVPRKGLSAHGSQREHRNLLTNWSTAGSH